MKNLLSIKLRSTGWTLLFLLCSVSLFSQANPKFTFVDPVSDELVLTNIGDMDVDVANYWLCLGPGTYVQISGVATSATLLTPGNSIVLPYTMDEANDGLSLFSTNTFGSSDPAILLDYVQWGAPNQPRVAQAVTAGRWDSAANFVAGGPAYFTATGGSAAAWDYCNVIAGEITLDDGSTSTSICVDGNPDPLNVNVAPGGVGTVPGWIITDAATDEILALPASPPFNLDGAGVGTCEIWYMRYEPGLQGRVVGNNLSDLVGCYDLSEPIEVIREEAHGGTVEIDIAATGNPNNTTSISADGLEAVICVDGRMDPLVVIHDNDSPNLTYRYVVTDNSADNTILAFFNTNSIDLDGAGIGTCRIWGWSYRGLNQNDFIGEPLSYLDGQDCSDISDNAIEVIREVADGGSVEIDIAATGNPNNSTVIAADGMSAQICVDGQADPLVVTHTNTAPNLTFRYVVTDDSPDHTILAIFNTNSINLDGAGIGTCRIWGWSYRGLDGSAFIGMPLQSLDDEDCSDISEEAIDVVREAPDGGTVEIDIAATGNPNNTTSISADGLEAVICVDGRMDPLVVIHDNDAPNLTYRYVVTDNSVDNTILAFFNTNSIDLDGAGIGTCRIWGWSYRGLNQDDFLGLPLSDLQNAGCSDISDNAVEVIREEADGGSVEIDIAATGNPNNTTSISADGLEAVICVDGRMDPLVVVHESTAPNLSFRYVVTDDSPDNTILAIFNTSSIDLDGAGIGTCRIWGWSYRGLDQDAFIGLPLADLQAEDCSDISDNAIEVIREEADGGTVEIDIDATGNPNNTTSISADGLEAVICVDGRMDPLVVVHENTAPNLSFRYVVTDDSPDHTILAIFNTNSIDLDGAGIGTCRIWGWSYRGLDQDAFIGEPLQALQDEDCSDISDNAVDVIREEAHGGTVEVDIDATGNPNNTTTISDAGTSVTICVDGRMDPLVVVHENDAPNLTYRYVVTDNSPEQTILAIFNTNSIDLDGAGPGVCLIWGWSYRGLDQDAFIGEPLADLQAEDCSDISENAITVVREAAEAGTVRIDIDATGNPNNTTSITPDGLEAVICVDGRMDPLVVEHDNAAVFLTYRYVVTDNSDDNTILAIFDTNAIDLDGAGIGTCRIWGWSYRGLNQDDFIGEPLQALQDEDCSDISDNAIEVIREEADGGTVSLANGDTEVTICAGDGIPDPLELAHVNSAPNLTFRYVVTDDSADNIILAIPTGNIADLEGAGPGVCRIWGWSYRGLDADAFIGEPLQALQDEDCSDISEDFVQVTRLTGDDCGILSVDDLNEALELSIYPNPARDIVNIAQSGSTASRLSVVVYDLLGRAVYQNNYNAQTETRVDVTSLTSGNYLIQITDMDSGAVAVKKLIKE